MTRTATKNILDQFKHIKPEGGLPIFKFKDAGDAIVAKLIERRVGISTKIGPGNAIDLDIIENANDGDLGRHTIFESGHITTIFDRHAPKPGDIFVLKLDSIDEKSGFKRFAFKVVASAGNALIDEDVPF